MHTESIEKIISYLIKEPKDDDSFRGQINILDMLNAVTDGSLFSTDYLLVRTINELFRIRIALGYSDSTVAQDDIVRMMENSIRTIIYHEGFDLKKAVYDAELPLDIHNPADVSQIINTFFTHFTDSMDRIYEQEVDAVQAMYEINALKHLLIDELYREKLTLASRIYNESGVEASVEQTTKFDAQIKRLKECNTTGELNVAQEFSVDNYESYLRVKQATPHNVRKLYKMGIKPFDDKFSICSNDIVVLIAEINAGKTRFVFDQLYKALMSGVNCTLICTETENELVLPKLILRHLFNLFKLTTLPIDLNKLDDSMEDESKKALFDDIIQKYQYAERDFWDGKGRGKLHVTNNIYYESCADEFYSFKHKYQSDIVFIDHTRALRSSGAMILGKRLTTQKEQLGYLAASMREAKMSYNLAFFVTSHPSSDVSKNLSSSAVKVTTNLAAGATEIAETATRMFYLTQTLEGEVKDTVAIHESKTRTEGKYRKEIILQRWGDSNAHTYDESMQIDDNATDSIGDIVDDLQ